MLPWNLLRQHARALRRPCSVLATGRLPCLDSTRSGAARRVASTSSTNIQRQVEPQFGPVPEQRIRPANSEKVDSARRVDAWLASLELLLPPHLQKHNQNQKRSASKQGTTFKPQKIFEALCGADRITSGKYGCDVLTYLAFEKGRWNLVVWLVKHLVEWCAKTSPTANPSTSLVCSWKNDMTLEELTKAPMDLQDATFLQGSASDTVRGVSIARQIDLGGHDRLGQNDALKPDILGMVWRGLGNMTIACAGGGIRPEILEIIAFLHHQELMPLSIYDSKPSSDATAIQQSPLLNLMSTRILTSLSDAAWRAHERMAAEESEDSGDCSASRKQRSPGTAINVRVEGLRPEVWLELILWSCLHGGWVLEGIKILQRIYSAQEPSQWRPLSWRSLVSEQPKHTQDWEKVEYLFNNRSSSSMDIEEPLAQISVQRTVSSELVNAYVDASVSVTRPPGLHKGQSFSQTAEFVNMMQQFLDRSGLALGAGSWDAIVLRLVDSQDTGIFKPMLFDQAIRLSPTMGQEIAAANVRGLPDYVFDGTAAIFGLFHRALHQRIKDADIEGALRLFASLQERADENKRRSVVDFLQQERLFVEADEAGATQQFTDNYSRIDYPAFYVQIPPNILGPFMELVTDAKAYEFGKWLLYSDEIDGPLIPESLYADPSITPALVRFAAETSDKALLSQLVKMRAAVARPDEPSLPRTVLLSFLESQINVKRWSAATKILQHMRDKYGQGWNVVTLCHLLRVGLLQVRDREAGDQNAEEHSASVMKIFRRLVRGGYEHRVADRPDYVQEQIDNLLVVVASVGGEWTELSVNTQLVTGYRVFNLPPRAFNLVLEGVVDAYGSHAGRKLIDTFWNTRVRHAQANATESDRQTTQPPFSSFGRELPQYIRQQRSEIRLPTSPPRKVAIYGGLRPNIMTIRVVLKKAIEELICGSNENNEGAAASPSPSATPSDDLLKADGDELDEQDPAIDTSPIGMVVWGAQCLKALGMALGDLERELRQSLPASRYHQVLDRCPDLLTTLDQKGAQGDENDDQIDQAPEPEADEDMPFEDDER